MQRLPVKRQRCFHHFPHRHPLHLKADALAAVGEQDIGQLAELVQRVQEGRAEGQPLAAGAVRHPVAALPAQHPAQLRTEKTVNTSGIAADKRRQHRQRSVALPGRKGIAPLKRRIPVRDHGALPRLVQAGRRRLQYRLPGLSQRLNKHRLPETAPRLTEAGRHQAAVLLRVGQLHAPAPEHRLRQLLHHRLRVGGIRHLLKFQAHAGDAGEPGL